MDRSSRTAEHTGDTDYHDVPGGDIRLCHRPGGRTAVVLGAGPGGLMAALTLRDEGYDEVIVLEKRSRFTRMNIVNLHPESLHILQRLGLLEAFLARASLIADHINHVYAGGNEIYHFHDVGHEVPINPAQTFDIADVRDGFRNETLYSISIADLQDLLTTVAVERGIQIVGQTEVAIAPGGDGMYSVLARRGPEQQQVRIDTPRLIVLSEGSRGDLYRTLGGRYVRQESLWPQETWVFGNYTCEPPQGYSHLLFEFCEDCDDLTISNCIFLPRRGEVNIAVTVSDPNTPASHIRELIEQQAAKVLRVSGIPSPDRRVVWHSNQPVRIVPKSAARTHFGKNIVLVGDAAGTNSPVAALGGTLCTSAYAYAIRELARDLEAHDADVALARYGERVQCYVLRWHNKVNDVRRIVNLDIRHNTMQRLVA